MDADERAGKHQPVQGIAREAFSRDHEVHLSELVYPAPTARANRCPLRWPAGGPDNWTHPPFEPTFYTAAMEAGGEPRMFPEEGEAVRCPVKELT